jgi:hypothetical protein
MNDVTEVREAGLRIQRQDSDLCRFAYLVPLPCASKISMWLIFWSKHNKETTTHFL